MPPQTFITPADWNWLADTYWYVPESSLPALQYDPSNGTLAWMIDQTVWHITGYQHGYFWGSAAVLLQMSGRESSSRQEQPVGMTLLGSITPAGIVQLTFIRAAARSSALPTIGAGRLLMADGMPRFQMQMSSGDRDRTLHWADMLQTRPGEPSWTSLPGVGISVEQMLNGIDAPANP